tara:strand:- start:143 stop:1282 length:1140 start_codon:yes stop_codon:yes gene_type:complete
LSDDKDIGLKLYLATNFGNHCTIYIKDNFSLKGENAMARIGVVGSGGMGKQHIKYLINNKRVESLSVFDINSDSAKRVSEQFGIGLHDSVESMIDDESIDAIFIVTPPATHAELCKNALEAGKHVFLEKPLSSTLEDAQKIKELDKKHENQFVMIGFPERFNGPNVELKKLIDNGTLGTVRTIRTNLRLSLATYGKNISGWVSDRNQGGGVVVEASVHSWDLMQWIGGAHLARVFAEGHSEKKDGKIYDTEAAAVGILKNGIIVLNDCTFTLPKGSSFDKKIEVIGTKAYVSIDYHKQNFLVYSTTEFEIGDANYKGLYYPDLFWFSESFGAVKNEQDEFINCIENNSQPESNVECAYSALKATFAVTKSMDTQKAVEL